jgi:8-oxo-dGTP pyrophosphatase MutT (NUDIX family)
MNGTKEIRVVAAVITDNRRVLATKRGQGRVLAGCFELPGGKVEPGETDEVPLCYVTSKNLSNSEHVDANDCSWSFAFWVTKDI